VANVKDLRKRIKSVKNTRQITRAMKMVAAAKLRRAQNTALAQRPYGRKMAEVLGALAAHSNAVTHPLFNESELKKTLLVVVTSDRGLCGSFNTNLNKRAAVRFQELQALGHEVQLYVIGRKGRDYFRRRKYPILKEKLNVFSRLEYGDAKHLADDLMEMFLAGQFGRVEIVYNEFLSVMQPRIVVETLLPVPPLEAEKTDAAVDYEFEPNPETIFAALVPWHVRTQVWRVLQESYAAELGSRMSAMDAASRNAGEMIDSLTLTMNKIRQAAITRELIEVVSGAAALT